MRRALMILLSCALAGGLLATPATSKRPSNTTTYEDPDDTPGKLDLASVSRTVRKTSGGSVFVHELTTYEEWVPNEFYMAIDLNERDPDHSSCYPGRCTGWWEGEIYWDKRNQELAGYLFEVTDCGDCNPDPIDVWRSGDRSVSFSLSPYFFYPDTRSYDVEFQTYWQKSLRIEASIDCRVQYCKDRLPNQGTVSFPVRRGRSS